MKEGLVLGFNLFDGDFGESGTRTLSNKIVITRKYHKSSCHMCNGDIAKGEKSRSQNDIYDDKPETYRVCNKCCEAISYDYENNVEQEIDKRYKLRFSKP